MKKIKALSVITAFAVMISFTGCSTSNSDNSGSGNSGGGNTTTSYKAGDTARDNISFGGVTYKKTGEVYVTGPDGATITGAANTNNFEGVFIAGRNVTLSPFIMGKYEVTQQLYTAVMTNQTVTANGSQYPLDASPFSCTETGEYPKVATDTQNLRPAETITWYDAVYFCNKLSEKMQLTPAYSIIFFNAAHACDGIDNDGDGRYDYDDPYEKDGSIVDGHIMGAIVSIVENANGYRLPTEAEWEFASRGGNPAKAAWNYLFSGAPTATGTVYTENQNTGLDAVGWYCNNLEGTTKDTILTRGTAGYGTHEVGKKKENALHIFDMSGNVREFCYDWRGNILATGSVSNPTGAESNNIRIERGGSWADYAQLCSVCSRGHQSPDSMDATVGFRIVRNAN